MWIFQNLTRDPLIATGIRAILALLLLLAGLAMLKVRLHQYPTRLVRFAGWCARVYAFGRFSYYAALILGGVPVVGVTSGNLTFLLLFGFTCEFILILALGFWAKESAFRRDKI
jgi:hypothetical protein